jgi:hypothetical protein
MSGLGSITLRFHSDIRICNALTFSDRSRNAALNMITACQVVEFGELGSRVFAFYPGLTVSKPGPMNDVEHRAPPTAEDLRPIRRISKWGRNKEAVGLYIIVGNIFKILR